MSTHIEFLRSNYFFNVTSNQSTILDFLLIRIPQNNKKFLGSNTEETKKFVGQVKLDNENILSQFSNAKELFQFMKDEANYEIDENLGFLFFKWEIYANNYRKAYKHKIELSVCPLDDEKRLQCEVFVLRKKIEIYEEAERKRLRLEIEEEQKDGNQVLLKYEYVPNPEKQASIKFFKTKNIRKNSSINKKKQKIKKMKKEFFVKTESERNEGGVIKIEDHSEQLNPFFEQKEKKQADKESHEKDDKKAKNESSLHEEIEENMKERKTENVCHNSEVPKIKGRRLKRKKKSGNKLESDSEESCDDYKKIKISDDKYQITFSNGDFYEGQLKDRKFEGFGKYCSKVTGVFSGFWKKGKYNGHGVLTGVNKHKYEGEFKDDLRHGKGTEVFENGDRYEGDYLDDFRNGIGTYYYSNGDWCKGEWKDDKQEGKGVSFEIDGCQFEGIWKNDEKEGEGVLLKGNRKFKQVWDKGILIKEEPMNEGQ